MSDLISRSELIENFRKCYSGHLGMENSDACMTFHGICNVINNTNTAYDVDKVVEDLELHSFEFGTDTLPAHYVRLNDAIEIVKQGGDANHNVVDIHLCDTCKKTYPECDGKNVKFGCDIDTYPNTRQNKDNIFYCDGYVKR